INNRKETPVTDKDNNRQTIDILSALISRRPFGKVRETEDLMSAIRKISERPVRIAYIDASSPGLEAPEGTGGVGMARKIGMDTALRVLKNSVNEPRLIISLDADTIVRPDYLTSVR